jgi:hypothetical protein
MEESVGNGALGSAFCEEVRWEDCGGKGILSWLYCILNVSANNLYGLTPIRSRYGTTRMLWIA